MTSSRKINKLICEDHPDDYSGYKFITLIQFNDDKFLTIVDRVTEKVITAYILDLCGPENIDEEELLDIAYNWSVSSRKNFPFSIELSRLGIADDLSNIHKSFNKDFIQRLIGPLPATELFKSTTKRKKIKKFLFPKNIITDNKSDK